MPLNSQSPNFNKHGIVIRGSLIINILLFKPLKIGYLFPFKFGKIFLLNICGDDVDTYS